VKILYILIQFGTSTKFMSIKTCLNKHMLVSRKANKSDTFPVQNNLQQDVLSPFHFNSISEYAKRDWNWMGHISLWSMLIMFIFWMKIHTIN